MDDKWEMTCQLVSFRAAGLWVVTFRKSQVTSFLLFPADFFFPFLFFCCFKLTSCWLEHLQHSQESRASLSIILLARKWIHVFPKMSNSSWSSWLKGTAVADYCVCTNTDPLPFSCQTVERSPPSPGQGMCLWVLLLIVAQDGVRKVVLSSLERLLDLSMWRVTLYLQENSRPGRLM